MDRSNSKGGLVVGILIGIIIMLIVGIGLFATNTISFSSKTDNNDSESGNVTAQNNNSNESYTYAKIKGVYTFESEKFDGVNGKDSRVAYKLFLYENGTFVYYKAYAINQGEIGNYTIDGNKILLNVLFYTGSDMAIQVIEKEDLKTLIINDNETIEDSSSDIKELYQGLNLDTIRLNKASSSEEEELLKNNNFIDIINQKEFVNKYSSKQSQ